MWRSIFYGFGLAFVIWGIFLLLGISFGITGFFILEEPKIINSYVFNIFFIVIGILLMTLGREGKRKGLEAEIEVYDESRGKGTNYDNSYRMTDPKLSLGQAGVVGLGEFKRQIAEFQREEGGDELVKIVKDEYGPRLREIALSADESRAHIAKEFLVVLGEKIDERDYHLTKEEKREIRMRFREFHTSPDRRQTEVIKKYGLEWDGSHGHGAHPKLVYVETGNKLVISSTPSDYRSTLNFSGHLIRFINEQRDIAYKRKQRGS